MKKLRMIGLFTIAAMLLTIGVLAADLGGTIQQEEETEPRTEAILSDGETENPGDKTEGTAPEIEDDESTEIPGNREEEAQLEVEDGRLTENSIRAGNLQETIDSYFALRSAAVNEKDEAVALTAAVADVERPVSNDAMLRADTLINYWANEGINIVSVENSAELLEAEMTTGSDTAELAVYEWTWVYYNSGEGPDSPATDCFGFSTYHDLVAAMDSEGTFTVIWDSYDESYSSGYASVDYEGIPAYPS